MEDKFEKDQMHWEENTKETEEVGEVSKKIQGEYEEDENQKQSKSGKVRKKKEQENEELIRRKDEEEEEADEDRRGCWRPNANLTLIRAPVTTSLHTH